MLRYFRTLTNAKILLCVWHVRRAWLKNVGSKVKGRENKIRIFRALGEIMHSCQDEEAVQNAIASLFDEFSEHKRFLEYFKSTWLDNNKICKFLVAYFYYRIMQCHICSHYFITNYIFSPDMWAKAYRKFPHSNQDTNNAIESYHGYIKQKYLEEKNNACHRRVDWLIYILLTKVVLYYIHMQRLKEVGFIRPRKIEEQLNASKCRANQIPNEDCVADEKGQTEYRVRSQNKDTHNTWYNVIYKGSNLHFCNCSWALNGNVCKHVLKVEMLVTNNILGDNRLPNASSSITERPRILVDLNEIPLLSPEKQIELPPCFDSPPNINCHNETSIVSPETELTEEDEMKFVISSTHEKLRRLLSIRPTNLEHAYALNNVVDNAHQEYNKMVFCTTTPSKITTKRRRSFLSPNNKKRHCGSEPKSGKDKAQFQRVGWVRAKKKSMDEQLERSSQRQRNVEHASDSMQHSIAHNMGMEILFCVVLHEIQYMIIFILD